MRLLPYIKLATITALFFGGVPFIASAQTGHFVFLSQGIQADDSGDINHSSWTGAMQFGLGYTGTTTGAFFTSSFTKSTAGQLPSNIILEQWTTSDYTSGSHSQCNYYGNAPSGFYPRSFVQLDSAVSVDANPVDGTSGCVLSPTLYTEVLYSFDFSSGFTSTADIFGSAATTSVGSVAYSTLPNLWFPQFAIVGDGFQITPTQNSTGLFLSGAQEFCNGQFGTSTGGVFGIGTDIANAFCQVGGYLFVPTPLAMQQFTALPNDLLNRFPFSWYTQVQTILSGLTASTTANYPTVFYDVAATASTSPEGSNIIGAGVMIADPNTIQALAPDSIWATLRYLIATILWISFAYMIYYQVMGIWRKTS